MNGLEISGIFVSNGILSNDKSTHRCKTFTIRTISYVVASLSTKSDRSRLTLRASHRTGVYKDVRNSISLGNNRGWVGKLPGRVVTSEYRRARQAT